MDIIVVKISDKTVNSLSLLNDLKKIRLKSNRFNGLVSITHTGVFNIINVCHSIQSIIYLKKFNFNQIKVEFTEDFVLKSDQKLRKLIFFEK